MREYNRNSRSNNITRINSIRRKRRLRIIKRRIAVGLISLLMIIAISASIFGIKASAQDKEHATQYKYYKQITIEKNDTLWKYAKEYAPDGDYNKYVKEVVSINNLRNSDDIKSGYTLTIPYYSTEYKL